MSDNRKALLIGINGYQHKSGLAPLRFAEADAEALAKVLHDKCGFEVKTLLGAQATRDAIEQSIHIAGQGELFLFFFAGHGQMLSGQYKLHPVDSTAAGFRALSFSDLARHWQCEFRYRNILAILDACRSEMRGTRGSRGFDPAAARDISAAVSADQRWIEVLYGCSEGQVSYEIDEFEHGLLTSALLATLDGTLPDMDSALLAGAAADWMRKWAVNDPQGRRQEVYRYYRPSLTQRMVLFSTSSGVSTSLKNTRHQGGERLDALISRVSGILTSHPPQNTESDIGDPISSAPQRKNHTDEATGNVAGEVRSIAGIEMVWIPPGNFLMGSSANEQGHSRSEPTHSVTLSRGCWMGKYAITRQEWSSVMKSPPVHAGDRRVPMSGISWDDCQAFTSELMRITGTPFRLPTEAEWEYACRAGNPGRFCFGDDNGQLIEYAWFDKCHVRGPQPVSQKKPNQWGLQDMHGNVWEWCQDWYGPYNLNCATDPIGPLSGTKRVIRGGAFSSFAALCRSAKRTGHPPRAGLPMIGVRLAVTL